MDLRECWCHGSCAVSGVGPMVAAALSPVFADRGWPGCLPALRQCASDPSSADPRCRLFALLTRAARPAASALLPDARHMFPGLGQVVAYRAGRGKREQTAVDQGESISVVLDHRVHVSGFVCFPGQFAQFGQVAGAFPWSPAPPVCQPARPMTWSPPGFRCAAFPSCWRNP